jgi:sugar phosphate isomerase/epimerase
MKKYRSLIILAFIILGTYLSCSPKELNNVFYVQNTLNGFTNAPKTPQEKAGLIKSIGFEGLEGFGYKDYFALKDALIREGLRMPVNYVTLPFDAEGILNDSVVLQIKEMIAASSKGEIMYFPLQSKSFVDDKETGDLVATRILRELSDYAALYDVRLCTYPHVNTYCETVAHSVKLAGMVDRKNYGAAMNLCHLLKVEGSEGIDAKIKEFVPYLFAVNICGADDGDTKQYGWERLIQPLGKGTFDTYGFIKLLIDNGYSGPIGLQCYNLKGDIVETLNVSMETWEGYKARYLNEKQVTF